VLERKRAVRAIGRFFGVTAAGSTLGREIVGGLTTFLTMAYIMAVNPVLLAAAGMPREGAVLATVVASAVATLAMGLVANLPVALAPGMGLNAFFAYTICINNQIPWQTALGLLAVVNIVFLALTVGRVRAAITDAVPRTLRFAAAVGIGLFITTIGLQHAGLVAPHPATYVTLGDLGAAHVRLALGGLAVTLALAARRVRTAIFWGVVATAVLAWWLGMIEPPRGAWLRPPSATFPGFEMDFFGALDPALAPFAFVLLFFAIFDAMGTLYAVGTEAGLLDEAGRFPRLGRALMVDAGGALAGALLGSSSVTCYIESATGVSVGARTGLANVVTAACFLLSLFFIPVVLALSAGVSVQSAAGTHTYYPITAPALIVVGVLMARSVVRIEWGELTEAVPAFLTLALMPATFSISHGLAAGFVSYAGMKLAAGKGREVHWIVYVLAALFAWRYLAFPEVR
jgi:AGZA family xanthine/uracil permease-like MFS transporter